MLPAPYKHKSYILNVLVGLDEFVNALTGGSPHETISSRAWRGHEDGNFWGLLFVPVIDFLFSPWQENHCQNAYAGSLVRNELFYGMH